MEKIKVIKTVSQITTSPPRVCPSRHCDCRQWVRILSPADKGSLLLAHYYSEGGIETSITTISLLISMKECHEYFHFTEGTHVFFYG